MAFIEVDQCYLTGHQPFSAPPLPSNQRTVQTITGEGSLPHELTPQVGLLGIQGLPEEPVLNEEKSRRAFSVPHLGHFA